MCLGYTCICLFMSPTISHFVRNTDRLKALLDLNCQLCVYSTSLCTPEKAITKLVSKGYSMIQFGCIDLLVYI